MAKTVTAEPDTSPQHETRQQRKKQAKKEAKIMLKVEQAKKDVGKAQKKLTRAQSNLDESQAHLHELEEQLQQIRTSGNLQGQASQTASGDSPDVQPEASQTQEVIDEIYQEPLLVSASTSPQTDTEAVEAFHTASIAPAEGRNDIVSNHETARTQEDISSYPSDEQNTPASEAIAETDTTSPEDTTANEARTLSPDEAQSLVEHGNEEPELSNNPNASSLEEQKSDPEENL